MGNIPCGITESTAAAADAVPDQTDGSIERLQYNYSNNIHQAIRQEQTFLKIHLSEMKKKCIVSSPDVIQAHVEQVEEFIRRNKIIESKVKSRNDKDAGCDNDASTISDVDCDDTDHTYDDDLDDFDGDDTKSHDGDGGISVSSGFARISSYFAPTVISATTQKAGNRNVTRSNGRHRANFRRGNNATSSISSRSRTSKQSNRRHGSNCRSSTSLTASKNDTVQPRIVGGMEFVESETTRKNIHKIVVEFYHQSWIQRNLYTTFLSSASPTVVALSSSLSSATTAAGRTLMTCHNPTNEKSDNIKQSSPTTIEFIQQVELYSSILQLRMNMKCYNYYQLHLLRRQSDHKYTKGIQNSMQSDMIYTPQAFQKHVQQQQKKIQLQKGYTIKHKHNHRQNGGREVFSTASSNSRNRYAIPELLLLSSSSDESESESQCDEQQVHFGIGPPSYPIQLLLTNSVFMDLAVTGSLGFNPIKRRISAAYVDRKVLLSPTQHIVVLNRRSGIPIAVCTLLTPISSSFPIVRMYTTKRRVPNQGPATTTGKLGFTWTESLPLYTWAEFVTDTIDPTSADVPIPLSYSIYYISDNGGDGTTLESSPKYRAVQEFPSIANTASGDGGSTKSMQLPTIKITGRTSREFQSTGCATLSMCTDADYNNTDDKSNDRFHHTSVYWKLSISQGIDPSVFICFSSFIDELMERTMRLICETNCKK